MDGLTKMPYMDGLTHICGWVDKDAIYGYKLILTIYRIIAIWWGLDE